MHEETLRRLYAGFDPEPFHIGLRYTRQPPTPEEFTVDAKADVNEVEAGTFAFTAAAVTTPAATAGATTAVAVFCFQDDNKHGQDRARSATNYC